MTELGVAEKELDDVSNSDRTINDQDNVDRLSELVTKVLEIAKKIEREGYAGKEGTDDDDLEEFEEVRLESKAQGAVTNVTLCVK